MASKDNQCFMKNCRRVAVKEISYYQKKVKVCKSHTHFDGLHEHVGTSGRYYCRCEKGK